MILVNRTFDVFLCATKTEKCRQIPYSLTDAVLSSSPDHGLFDNNKIFSETPSKRSSIIRLQKVGVDNFASWAQSWSRCGHWVSTAIEKAQSSHLVKRSH